MNESVLFYLIIIFSASILASLSQIKLKKNSKVNEFENSYYNRYFIFASFLCLALPVAFRDYTGTDYASYVEIYNNISYFGPISMFPRYEIGYLVLNYLCFLIFDDYHSLFIIVALVSNILIYKGILYERSKINLGIAIFVYGFTLFFLEFVMIRNLLGIAIVFYGYRFLLEGNKNKFYIIVLIACMFHYSLAFYFLIGVFFSERLKKIRFPVILILGAIIAISPSIINNIINSMAVINPRFSYYAIDILNNEINLTLYMIAYTLPLIPFIIYFRKLIKHNSNNYFYFYLYIISAILLLLSSFNPIITGYAYSLWPALIILTSSFVEQFKKTKALKILIIIVVLLYGTALIIEFVTIQSYSLIPYKDMFGIW